MMEDSAQKIAEKILQYTELEGKTVLEVGCGDGRVTSLIAGLSKRMAAVEPDERQIRKAGHSVAGVDFQVGSGECLHFGDKCFDVILFTLSLHHQKSAAALAEAERTLKDDGTILVIEPSEDGEIEQLFGVVHDERKEKQDAQAAMTESSLLPACSEHFKAHWIFESREELCRIIFDYYDMPFDEKTACRVLELLETMRKPDEMPLKLEDTMTIQSLKKQLPDIG